MITKEFKQQILSSTEAKISYWLSKNPSKANADCFFMFYSIVWIIFFAIIIIFKLYEKMGDIEFMIVGITVGVPFFFYPFICSDKEEKIAITHKYWFKANLWVAIVTFNGNYFITHYFFLLLGAHYNWNTTWNLNQIPIFLYFITHGYFMTYHVCISAILRKFWSSSFYGGFSNALKPFVSTIFLLIVSCVVAFMETTTVSSVPYYWFDNRKYMLTVGTLFYGLFLFVTFSMFYRIDEEKSDTWTLSRTAIDAFAASMLVITIYDFWRITFGPTESLHSPILPFTIIHQN